MNEFVECKECKSKPGSPELCEGCYQNRRTIANQKRELERVKGILDLITLLCTVADDEGKNIIPAKLKQMIEDRIKGE